MLMDETREWELLDELADAVSRHGVTSFQAEDAYDKWVRAKVALRGDIASIGGFDRDIVRRGNAEQAELLRQKAEFNSEFARLQYRFYLASIGALFSIFAAFWLGHLLFSPSKEDSTPKSNKQRRRR